MKDLNGLTARLRADWPTYAMHQAFSAAMMRCEDPYMQVGACILRHDNTVASVGYNGPPPNVTIDWSNRDERRRRVCHAEASALRYIKPGEGKLIAVTLLPCSECIKDIAHYKINTIYYDEIYCRDTGAFELAKDYGLELIQLSIDKEFKELYNKLCLKLKN